MSTTNGELKGQRYVNCTIWDCKGHILLTASVGLKAGLFFAPRLRRHGARVWQCDFTLQKCRACVAKQSVPNTGKRCCGTQKSKKTRGFRSWAGFGLGFDVVKWRCRKSKLAIQFASKSVKTNMFRAPSGAGTKSLSWS